MTKPRGEKTPPRPSMSKARRARIFMKENGRCYLCGEQVRLGQLFEIEHRIPWALSFDDSDDNLRLAHATCHRTMKTGDDVRQIAKAKRQSGETGQQARRAKRKAEEAERGIVKPKAKLPSRPFPKGQSRWAKRKVGE